LMNRPAFAEAARFINGRLTNLGGTVAKGDVEQAEVAQIGDGKTPPKAPGEGTRERLQHRLPVLGPLLATLHALDDLAPAVPVGEDHLAVHRADGAGPRVLQDGDDAVEEGVGLALRDGGDGGAGGALSALAGRLLLHADSIAGGRCGWATRGS